MKYVISDIHGDYEKYVKLLQVINFNEEDILYVLGDVVDRGKHGIKILQHMMQYSNIIPILGNHELMAYRCLKWLLQEITYDAIFKMNEEQLQIIQEWIINGGDTTIEEFQKLSLEERKEILYYLKEFWGFVEVEVNGTQYLLIHAGFEDFDIDKPLYEYDLEELVWARMDVEQSYFKDKIIVFGHTPTRHFYAKKQGKLLSELSEEEYCDTIFISDDGLLIGIDCGCGFGGKLGCICLDTGEQFYV